jgi:tetratricopeptide (TPR) repeat protein
MKKTVLLLPLLLAFTAIFAQQKDKAEAMVGEGIKLHDQGDYTGALNKYDQALELDKDNFLALAEKAYTYVTMQQMEDAVLTCQHAISVYPGDKSLPSIYTTYGTALDYLKKPEQAIQVYDEGIRIFPDDYELYFNRGVTLASVQRFDEALGSFQHSMIIQPFHASSHHAVGVIEMMNGNKIPALMAICNFMIVEPDSKRAATNLETLKAIMSGNAEKTGRKSVSITIDAGTLADTTADGKNNPNNFGMTEMMLSIGAALDYDKEYKKENDVERFLRKFELVCSTLATGAEKNSGIYWDFYAPFFVEMKAQGHLETLGYLVFASANEQYVSKWINAHENEIGAFYNWVKQYKRSETFKY